MICSLLTSLLIQFIFYALKCSMDFFHKSFISLLFGFSLGNFYTILLIPGLTFFFTSGNILYSKNIPQKYYIWDLLQNNSLGSMGIHIKQIDHKVTIS